MKLKQMLQLQEQQHLCQFHFDFLIFLFQFCFIFVSIWLQLFVSAQVFFTIEILVRFGAFESKTNCLRAFPYFQ